jgi:diketogulonate reductase-like aldo/keto reductase
MAAVNRRVTYKLYPTAEQEGLLWQCHKRHCDLYNAALEERISAYGVNHIDTSDFYGPHITNQLIREALHPYPDELIIVTKIGARRGADGSWIPAVSPDDLTRAVYDNLRNLGLDVLDVVNFRSMHGVETGSHGPAEGSIEAPLTVLAELQQKGLVRHIGVSNVTPAQIAEARRICEIVCVQYQYNVAHRADDALIDDLACNRIPYVPLFSARRFQPAAIVHLGQSRRAPRCHTDAGRPGLVASSRIQHSSDPRYVICGAYPGEPRLSRAQLARRRDHGAERDWRLACVSQTGPVPA